MESPKCKLEFWTDERGHEKINFEIPKIDKGSWKFANPSAEREVLGQASKAVGAYFNDRNKEHAWLEMVLNILLQRATEKGAIVDGNRTDP